MSKDILYYDGACPLCSAEIRKLARYCGDGLIFEDIHALSGNEGTPGKQQLLSRLHLKTADGQWITGLRANIRAWEHTPLRYFWRILDWPLVSPVSHWCYEFWLRKRAGSKRKYCADSAACPGSPAQIDSARNLR